MILDPKTQEQVMVVLIVFTAAVVVVGAYATRRAEQRRGHNPNDIYPLW